MTLVAATVRIEIAGYLSALLLVYSVLIIGWVVQSWVLASGISVGRFAPVFHFLDSVVGPFMNLFRKYIPPLGPVDISPLVALLVVQIGGGLVVSLVHG